MVDMDMDVDNPRGNIVPSHINHLGGQGWIDVCRHRRHLTALDSHIHFAVNLIQRVDHMAIF